VLNESISNRWVARGGTGRPPSAVGEALEVARLMRAPASGPLPAEPVGYNRLLEIIIGSIANVSVGQGHVEDARIIDQPGEGPTSSKAPDEESLRPAEGAGP
jgi:hypothetical protein